MSCYNVVTKALLIVLQERNSDVYPKVSELDSSYTKKNIQSFLTGSHDSKYRDMDSYDFTVLCNALLPGSSITEPESDSHWPFLFSAQYESVIDAFSLLVICELLTIGSEDPKSQRFFYSRQLAQLLMLYRDLKGMNGVIDTELMKGAVLAACYTGNKFDGSRFNTDCFNQVCQLIEKQ